ncbi:MAG: OmpP1/FadL family transporter [Hyphomicrobium sp.]
MTALIAMSSMAAAGGFAPKEQSAVFLGSAFAGSAAGGSLGSMFWNPAALGQFNGVNSESAYSLILPDTEITAIGGPGNTSAGLLTAGASSGDIGDTAVLPASYFSYQLSEQLVLGLGVNAPFGLTTDGNFSWAGSVFARESKITTYNFTPTVAYRVTPGVIVGAGIQIEYIDAQLRQAFGAPNGPTSAIKGDDVGYGFTAGVIVEPAAGTTIGLGFRSKIEHDLEGTFHVAGDPAQNQISADIELPEIVTLSLRQAVAPTWTLLGTVEWTNWSRLPELRVNCDALGLPACGGPTLAVLPLDWEDGWFFSAGIEHEYSPVLTLRGGAAWEKSPIQSAEGRTIRVPDADRVWLSAGASYKYSEWTTIDLAYAHVFVDDAETIQVAPTGARLVGDVESSADILSVGVRSKLDWLFSGSY